MHDNTDGSSKTVHTTAKNGKQKTGHSLLVPVSKTPTAPAPVKHDQQTHSMNRAHEIIQVNFPFIFRVYVIFITLLGNVSIPTDEDSINSRKI
jgi:hypothetical protein